MKAQVNYTVPVSATVDLDAGRVEEVLVWPTAIQQSEGEHDFVVAGTQLPATLEQRARARDVAASQGWPGWRIA